MSPLVATTILGMLMGLFAAKLLNRGARGWVLDTWLGVTGAAVAAVSFAMIATVSLAGFNLATTLVVAASTGFGVFAITTYCSHVHGGTRQLS